jgi:hypothetical protein
MALIFPGVLPSIVFASSPTASTVFFPELSTTATTEGSFKTTPSPFTYTNVLAVPKSIAISFENSPNNLSININLPWIPLLFLIQMIVD